MIKCSISYSFDEENNYHITDMPNNIQLAFFKYEHYEKSKDKVFKIIKENSINVNVVHLPTDIFNFKKEVILKMIEACRYKLPCKKFVIHPNKGIGLFIFDFIVSKIDAELCIENFQWRKKKELRSPLQIIEKCVSYRNKQLSLTLDTSHLDLIFFNHMIIPYILKHTSVIHLSNRKGKEQHLPFNIQDADLNLIKFINDLKTYNWSGNIVLEYMPDYQNKLIKNYYYLWRLVK